jgi:hypothetical protein
VHLISGEQTAPSNDHLYGSEADCSDWERHLALATVRLISAYRLLEQVSTDQMAPNLIAFLGAAFKCVCQSVVAVDDLTQIVWPDAAGSAKRQSNKLIPLSRELPCPPHNQ